MVSYPAKLLFHYSILQPSFATNGVKSEKFTLKDETDSQLDKENE